MEKILTVLGTRPEIIRLSRIIPKLDSVCDHRIIHTGQNYDKNLNDIFFDELKVRQPDYFIESKSSTFAEQFSKIMIGFEKLLSKVRPDKVLILGDTNSSLIAFLIERYGIPVYHMEAGNRCFDKKVPEEINRRVIDSISSYNLPYTLRSKENLLNEGVNPRKIFVSGNPIYEVMKHYESEFEKSDILKRLNITGDYITCTAHRAENVDNPTRLQNIFNALLHIKTKYGLEIVFSCHPRTKNNILKNSIKTYNIYLHEPFGFFDFLKLEKYSRVIISDSGTVQEEACIFNVPAVTIRDTTERPETIECGSNIISGLETHDIIKSFNVIKDCKDWELPEGYNVKNVSSKVVNFLLSNKLE